MNSAIILAVETSSKAASCALTRGGKLMAELYSNTGLTHSQTIMPMVQRLLEMSDVDPADVNIFAVSAGPGSFTGLRIGIAAVKGMAMALDKPCAPVSTLHGLALNASFFAGLIVPVLDARRNQVYTALFQANPADVSRVTDDEVIALTELEQRLLSMPGPKMLIGDGAALAMEKLTGVEGLCVAPPPLVYQRASSLCIAAAQMAETGGLVSAHDLAPLYLRLPQAERELTLNAGITAKAKGK